MKKEPRGFRNNNPGNIRRHDWNDWQGEVPESQKTDKEFEQFTEMRWGVRAVMKLLLRYYRVYRIRNIRDLIWRWAPENENNTSAYVEKVSIMMGKGKTVILNMEDEKTMCDMVDAIIYVENGEHLKREQIEEGWNLLMGKKE